MSLVMTSFCGIITASTVHVWRNKMATLTENKSLTVRLHPDLYAAAAQVARKSGRSLNALIQQGLKDIIRAEEDREMYEAATLLGRDADECDVAYALPAQVEVILRDER